MSQRFAVIGQPIDHSLSPVIHHHFAEQTQRAVRYEKITGNLESFEQQVSTFFTNDGKGLNVTLPCKERAFAMAHIRTERCLQAKAANTLWMQDKMLHADNTDGVGLVRDLAHYLDLNHMTVLILGAGGVTRGILGPLLQASAKQVVVANRSLPRLQALVADFPQVDGMPLDKLSGRYDLIINATAVGHTGASLVLPDSLINHRPFCYDLSYSQQGTTTFVAYAQSQGCLAVDGLGMLVEQAAEAFTIWHGVRPNTQAILAMLKQRK